MECCSGSPRRTFHEEPNESNGGKTAEYNAKRNGYQMFHDRVASLTPAWRHNRLHTCHAWFAKTFGFYDGCILLGSLDAIKPRLKICGSHLGSPLQSLTIVKYSSIFEMRRSYDGKWEHLRSV